MSKNELKMSLKEIRDRIDLNPHPWINLDDNNCYAYALGLDVDELDIFPLAFQPGVISDAPNSLWMCNRFGYSDLTSSIYSDLMALGIDYREISPLEKIEDNEWKISLFVNELCGALIGFQFLRQLPDGVWYYKDGYGGEVKNCDSNGDIILNPEKCSFTYLEYYKCYSLKLK